MLSHLFLGISLVGAEWVLYLLVLLSVLSVTLIFERALFYRTASKGLLTFRSDVRKTIAKGDFAEAARLATARKAGGAGTPDLETEMVLTVASHSAKVGPQALTELAQDSVIRARIEWEKNLGILATIGANAPFIGLFGTVLGIIKAFHDLSQQAGTGAQTVSSGISEALIATAMGLLVAIPAVVAFNIFQRKVKASLGEAEALKSYLVGKLGQ